MLPGRAQTKVRDRYKQLLTKQKQAARSNEIAKLQTTHTIETHASKLAHTLKRKRQESPTLNQAYNKSSCLRDPGQLSRSSPILQFHTAANIGVLPNQPLPPKYVPQNIPLTNNCLKVQPQTQPQTQLQIQLQTQLQTQPRTQLKALEHDSASFLRKLGNIFRGSQTPNSPNQLAPNNVLGANPCSPQASIPKTTSPMNANMRKTGLVMDKNSTSALAALLSLKRNVHTEAQAPSNSSSINSINSSNSDNQGTDKKFCAERNHRSENSKDAQACMQKRGFSISSLMTPASPSTSVSDLRNG